jgi:hypothetical protein
MLSNQIFLLLLSAVHPLDSTWMRIVMEVFVLLAVMANRLGAYFHNACDRTLAFQPKHQKPRSVIRGP